MKTFEFALDNQMNITRKPEVNVVKFGDGYEQRQPKGIAPILSQYDVSRIADTDTIKAIDAFLVEHGGVTAFLWTPDNGKQGKFVCDSWTIEHKLPYPSFSATFREVRA